MAVSIGLNNLTVTLIISRNEIGQPAAAFSDLTVENEARRDVSAFVGDTDQFDDLTMQVLAVRL